jgi:hypothetical protein
MYTEKAILKQNIPVLQGLHVLIEATRKIMEYAAKSFVDTYGRADPKLRENDVSGSCITSLRVCKTSYPRDSNRQHCSYAKSLFNSTDLNSD